MSLKQRIKKLENVCGSEDRVVFLEVSYEGDAAPAYTIVMVNSFNRETDGIIEAYRHEHPGVEVRVQSRCD